METVLYEYHFNVKDWLPNLIPLVVGLGFLFFSISLVKEKERETGWEGFITSFFKIVGFVVGPIGIGLFVLVTIGMVMDHMDYKQSLTSNNVRVVEGYVEKFHPMPYEGHDTEHFEINGVYFEYSDFVMGNGYHQATSHGGVIDGDGQYLKIKYIEEEYDGIKENIILYIAEVK